MRELKTVTVLAVLAVLAVLVVLAVLAVLAVIHCYVFFTGRLCTSKKRTFASLPNLPLVR